MTYINQAMSVKASSEGIKKVRQCMAELVRPNNHDERGWTIPDLAERSGAGESTVKRFLKGIPVKFDSLVWITGAVGLKPEDVIDAPLNETEAGIVNWIAICGEMLDKQKEARQLRKEATAIGAEVNVYVPLDLLEHKEQTRSKQDKADSDQRNQYQELKVVKTYEHNDFLRSLTDRQSKNKHIAIVGEAGAGKTTLLARIADELDKNQKLQIFVSLADLQGRSLEDHIYGKWLSEALGVQKDSINAEQKNDLFQQFQSGEIWLLLDGLDEMRAKSSADALEKINREIREVIGQSRVVLTSRLNVWDAYLNRLSGFDTFRMGDFSPEQVDQFICDWFVEAGKTESAPILQAKLKEPNRDRIRDMVRHPLRLALLCQAFYRDLNTELPETKAGLYELFVRYFYEWKPNIVDEDLTQDTLREELHLALGKLAIAGIDGDAGFRLSRSLAVKEMGDRLFKLASDVGWLTLIERDEQDQEVYAFYHASFQEYFAALAIPSWKFFLDHDIYNLENGIYRVFQTQWIETIILWFGNQLKSGNIDIASDFIYALSNFDDLINPERIYSYRAHFIATICVGEIGLCELSESLIEKTVEIYLSYLHEKAPKNIYQAAKDSLKQTNLYIVKIILEKRINESNDRRETSCLASLLLEICPTSSIAISSLVSLVNDYYIEENYNQVWGCIGTLIEIRKENLNSVLSIFFKTIEHFREKGFNDYRFIMSFNTIKSISGIQRYHKMMKEILNEIIINTNDNGIHWFGLCTLAEINPEMTKKIASRWLKNAQDEQDEDSIYSNAHLLLRASKSSLEAFTAFSNLLDSNDCDMVKKCIEHLGDLKDINQKEIVSTGILSKLIKLASSLICNGDEDLIVRRIAQTFGDIGIADQQVIQTLENIIEKVHPENSNWGSSQAAVSLNKLGYDISKYESFFENKLISYPPNIFYIYISTQASIARVLKIINPNNLLATEILLEDVFTLSDQSWYSYEYLVETIPYSSIEVLSFIVSFLQNNGKNALKKKKSHSDLSEFEEKYHELIWICAQNMSYQNFYFAWHKPTLPHPEIADTNLLNATDTLQKLEGQLINFDAVQEELDRNTDHPEIRCLVIDIRQLEQESDLNVIAKKLTNKIFNSIGRRIPVVQDVSCLERELLNLKFELGFEKLAIALYGKSANEAIDQLCQSLTESIPIHPFTGEQTTQKLIAKINAWLSEM